jgi:hypothetical protein
VGRTRETGGYEADQALDFRLLDVEGFRVAMGRREPSDTIGQGEQLRISAGMAPRRSTRDIPDTTPVGGVRNVPLVPVRDARDKVPKCPALSRIGHGTKVPICLDLSRLGRGTFVPLGPILSRPCQLADHT